MDKVDITKKQLEEVTKPDDPPEEKRLTPEQLEHLADFDKLRLPKDYRGDNHES